MKTIDNDMQLRELLKNFKPEKPGSDFTSNVMNRVFAEEAILRKIRSEKVFGKGFWILLGLFIVVISAMFIVSYTGLLPEGQLSAIFRGMESSGLGEGYNSFFAKAESLPLSLAGIFVALSILLFADKFLISKRIR